MIETADEGAGDRGDAKAPRRAAAATPAPARPAHDARLRPTPAGAGPAGSDERGPAETAAAPGRRRAGSRRRRAPQPAAAATAPVVGDPDARMTPAVRRLLREHELSAAQIVGTGGGGRITREDVLKVVESIRTGAPAPAPAAPASGAGQAAIGTARSRPRSPATPAPHGRRPPASRSSSPRAPTRSSSR